MVVNIHRAVNGCKYVIGCEGRGLIFMLCTLIDLMDISQLAPSSCFWVSDYPRVSVYSSHCSPAGPLLYLDLIIFQGFWPCAWTLIWVDSSMSLELGQPTVLNDFVFVQKSMQQEFTATSTAVALLLLLSKQFLNLEMMRGIRIFYWRDSATILPFATYCFGTAVPWWKILINNFISLWLNEYFHNETWHQHK